MSFDLEVGIPVPHGRSGMTAKYPYSVMDVGQSFFIPFTAEQPERKRMRQSATWATKRYTPKRFTVREVEGGMRIWRTE